MKARLFTGLTALGFALLAGCGGRQPVEINPDAQSVATRWNGTLSTPAELTGVSAIRGLGWMGTDPKQQGQTRAYIEISNAVPGGVHPWHVHRGQCGSDQGILGSDDSYEPLKVNNDGKASQTAQLAIPLPRSGSFFLQVHASPKNLSTIIACGNLAPPAR